VRIEIDKERHKKVYRNLFYFSQFGSLEAVRQEMKDAGAIWDLSATAGDFSSSYFLARYTSIIGYFQQ
jgi:hypothetical protein